MFDTEVFLGKALQVITMPAEIRTKEDLLNLLRQYLDHTISQQIEDAQVISPQGFDNARLEEKAVAAIKFRTPESVDRILSMGNLISVGRLDGFELRRCQVSLGNNMLVFDGIVRLPVQPNDTTAAPPCVVSSSTTHGNTNIVAPRQPENEKLKNATPIPVKSHERSGQKVDMTMNFILVFSSSGGGSSKTYDLRPYVVAQILRDHVVPASIAMLPLKKNVRKNCDNHRVLLEVYEQDVNTLISVFDGIIVELVSPSTRHGKEEMMTEARFRVFANVSPEFKGVMERRRKKPGDCGEVYEPARVHPDGFVFKRVWMSDPLSEYTQPKLRASGRGGDGDSQRSGSHSDRERHDRSGRERRNYQSLSASHEQERLSSKEPQSKRFRIDGPAAQAPVQQHGELVQQHGNKVHTSREKSPIQSTYSNPQAPLVESSAGMRTVETVPVRKQSVNQLVDTSEPLPPGWRAVYSHEYKRVYYVYKCPTTGKEMSTWTFPTNDK